MGKKDRSITAKQETMYTETVGETMAETVILGDIPDLNDVFGDTDGPAPFEDGWYQGTVLARREFTDSNGNDRVFESSDTVSAAGTSRNIRLQLEIKRASDGRTLNTSTLINYNPNDISAETIQAVAKRREETRASGNQMGDLFRPFMTLQRLAKLQKVAGVRQFKRNGDGSLDLSSLYGKTAYFRLQEDSRNPQYKEVGDFRFDAPKKAKVQ